ncbi:MAG: RIP metalloprotease RseP [Burkholderiaceae bacterium]
MTTVLYFLLAIGVLVTVHEWGHYRMARACGVKVLRFSVGFGPVLLRRQAHADATEWVLCALPLGGYVRMLDSREEAVAPQQLPRAFDQRPLIQRSLIVAAGPLANLLLAVLLYAAAAWWGTQEPVARLASPVAGSLAERAGLQAGDRVVAACIGGQDPLGADAARDCVDIESLGQLHWQLTRAALDRSTLTIELAGDGPSGTRRAVLRLTEMGGEVDEQFIRRVGLTGAYNEPVIQRVVEGGAAQAAGVKAGDRVLAVDGWLVRDASALRERIRAWGAAARGSGATADTPPNTAAQRWRILRDGREMELEVRPQMVPSGDGPPIGRVEAVIGTAPETVLVRRDAGPALVQGVSQSLEMSWLTIRMIGRMIIGEASLKQLSGPLTIADAAGQSAQRGATQYLGFLALVSVSLFVLNLVPLPMLDGGHLMYHLFEALTGRPPSEVWLERLQRIGMVLLLMLMAVALTNDVLRLLGPN